MERKSRLLKLLWMRRESGMTRRSRVERLDWSTRGARGALSSPRSPILHWQELLSSHQLPLSNSTSTSTSASNSPSNSQSSLGETRMVTSTPPAPALGGLEDRLPSAAAPFYHRLPCLSPARALCPANHLSGPRLPSNRRPIEEALCVTGNWNFYLAFDASHGSQPWQHETW
jgi:hypothetical protein